MREKARGGPGVLRPQPRRDDRRDRRAPARAVPGRAVRGRPRPARREGARGADAVVPARRGRRARRDEHHRVGHRHPAGQHADRRARRHLRARPALPDPRARRPLPRARLRLPAVPGARRADRGGDEAPRPRSATTPSSAPASRSRCATSRSAAPATCSATSSPATSRRSASSCTCRCSTRRSRDDARAPTQDEFEPVRLDVNVDAYVPADYIPYEQAKIDVHRRIAGAREVADLGALREELEDRFGPVPEPLAEPARRSSRRASSWARPGPARSASAAVGWRSRRSISTPSARSA